MNLSVIGAATTKFGELWGSSPENLAKEAFENALRDANLDKESIKALFVSNLLARGLGGQGNLGALFAEELGLTGIPAMHTGGNGGLALFAAMNSVLSGKYQTVAVIGVEKMTDYDPRIIAGTLMKAASEDERNSGTTMAGLYAMMARSYMQKYGTTENQLAAVPVKNHFHASMNQNAQFHKIITIDAVLKSSLVADPLKIFDCAPISDGASALIITSLKSSGVKIIASEIATDCLGLAQRQSLTEMKSTQIAAQKAYKESNLIPSDIDVAEVDDSFGIAEIIALEDLGFFDKGRGALAITKGKVTLGSSEHLVVNASGGLKGGGNPIGASGIKQIVEIVGQLNGKAGAHQVKNAKIGLAQIVQGSGATSIIHILKK